MTVNTKDVEKQLNELERQRSEKEEREINRRLRGIEKKRLVGFAYGLNDIEITKARKNHKNGDNHYEFDIKAFFYGEPDDFERVLHEIRKTFRYYIALMLGRKHIGVALIGKKTKYQDIYAEFILSVLSEIERLIAKNPKSKEARAYFKLVEFVLPDLKDNPRIVEIEDTFNIIDDEISRCDAQSL